MEQLGHIETIEKRLWVRLTRCDLTLTMPVMSILYLLWGLSSCIMSIAVI